MKLRILGLSVVMAVMAATTGGGAAVVPDAVNMEPVGWVELTGWKAPDGASKTVNMAKVGDRVFIAQGSEVMGSEPLMLQSCIYTIDVGDPGRPQVVRSDVHENVRISSLVATEGFLFSAETPHSLYTAYSPGRTKIYRPTASGALEPVKIIEGFDRIHVVADLVILSKRDYAGIKTVRIMESGEIAEVAYTEEFGQGNLVIGQKLSVAIPQGMVEIGGDGSLENFQPLPRGASIIDVFQNYRGISFWLPGVSPPRRINVVQGSLGFGIHADSLQVTDLSRIDTPYFLKATYPTAGDARILVDGSYVYLSNRNSCWVLRYTGEPEGEPMLNAELVTAAFPPVMTAGQSADVTVELRNTGVASWSGDFSFKLAVVDGAEELVRNGATRFNIPNGVRVDRGETHRFVVPLEAPGAGGSAGEVTLRLQMMQEWL